MEFHEIANIFPMMNEAEYESLRDDIELNGLIEPMSLYEGRILDGRNRYRACVDLDLLLTYDKYIGYDPLGFVLSKNLKRRHLTSSQLAVVALEVEKILAVEAKKRQGQRTDILPVLEIGEPIHAAKEASKTVGVSTGYIAEAKKLEAEAPELLEEVRAGEINIPQAKRELSKIKNPVLYSSESDEWNTPTDLVERVIDVMRTIDLDPCSNSTDNPNIPANKYHTKEDDGLAQFWIGKIYMNPPYGRDIPMWIDKLVDEFIGGNVTEAIALLPSRTDTKWFRKLKAYPRCFIWGRLKFNNQSIGATFPSMAVYLGINKEKFIEVFGKIGDIYERI